MLGCVKDILVPEDSSIAYVTLYAYEWLADDDVLKMPSVQRKEYLVASLATVSL